MATHQIDEPIRHDLMPLGGSNARLLSEQAANSTFELSNSPVINHNPPSSSTATLSTAAPCLLTLLLPEHRHLITSIVQHVPPFARPSAREAEPSPRLRQIYIFLVYLNFSQAPIAAALLINPPLELASSASTTASPKDAKQPCLATEPPST